MKQLITLMLLVISSITIAQSTPIYLTTKSKDLIKINVYQVLDRDKGISNTNFTIIPNSIVTLNDSTYVILIPSNIQSVIQLESKQVFRYIHIETVDYPNKYALKLSMDLFTPYNMDVKFNLKNNHYEYVYY
jgi:hypothetical protein